MTETEEFLGPLTPEPEQLEAVVALADRVFRPGRPGRMARDFPLLFRRDRMEQVRVFFRGAEPVSLVGMVLNDVVLLGCSVRVACIGSVCTDESARGRGLAGRLMDDAAERAVAAGASVMLISGDRTLYNRRGAFSVGRFGEYRLPASSLAGASSVTVSQVPPDEAGEALRMYEAEPIRFRRSEADYATRIARDMLMDRPAMTCLVRRGGEPAAVLSLNTPQAAEPADTPIASVRELAGSRPAVLEGLAPLAEQLRAEVVTIDAYVTDRALRDVCEKIGIRPEFVSFPRTVKLLDADRLWGDFWPLLAERVGDEMLSAIRMSSRADELEIHTMHFEMGDERWEVQTARGVLAALFGLPGEDPLQAAPGRLGEALRRALPLPLPLYGMNYV